MKSPLLTASFALIPLVLAPSAPAQESHALFDAPVVVASKFQMITDVADRDGDGWADAYGWWEADVDRIDILGWGNDHTGNFVQDFQITGFQVGTFGFVATAAGDLDHDGRADYVMCAGNKLLVFRANPSGAPTLIQTTYVTTYANGLEPKSIALADFTGDGWLDIACLSGGHLRILANVPSSGAFVDVSEAFVPAGEIVAGDVTGDGTPDIVGNYGNYGAAVFVWPVVAGQLQPALVFQNLLPYHTDTIPAVGDIDHDGDVDIVLFGMEVTSSPTGPHPAELAVVRNGGPGILTAEPLTVGGPARRFIDVNGDGNLDAVCCGGGTYYRPTNVTTSTFRIALGHGNGRFDPAIELPGIGSSRIAGAVDLDHDGDIDLVGGRCVYYAHGPITKPIAPLAFPRLQEPPGQPIAPMFDSAIDHDGDGDPDFAQAITSVSRNDGAGTYTRLPSTLPPLPAGNTWELGFDKAFFGDFDGDGRVDVLAPYRAGTQLRTRLAHGLGGGVFTDGGDASSGGVLVTWPVQDTIIDPLAADVDGDGDLDVITPLGNSSVWLNDGTGHFSPAFAFGPGNEYARAVRDLDGDGLPDLVTVSGFAPYVRWRRGLGAGTFSAPIAIGGAVTLLNQLWAVDVADLDGDGDTDVVAIEPAITIAPLSPGGLHLLENNGSGTFTDTVIGPPATSVRALDVNLDGKIDLVAATGSERSIAQIFLRRADNLGYEPPIEQVFGRGSITCVTDVDGDGDADLVLDRVYKNRRLEPPACGARLQSANALPGSGGVAPMLGATGPFRVGEHVTLRLRGARPGTTAHLYDAWIKKPLSTLPDLIMPAAHGQPYTAILPLVTSGTPSDLDGSGEWTLTFTVPPYKAGRTYALFVDVDDFGAPSGASRSNTLWITYGP